MTRPPTGPPWILAVSEWTLHEPSTGRALDRIAAAGFTAVEQAHRADTNTVSAARAWRTSGLKAVAICPFFDADDDLAAVDSHRRQRGVDLLASSVSLAETVGAPVVILVPSITRTSSLA